MMKLLLYLATLIGLGYAWTQPSTCYVRPTTSSNTAAVQTELTEIREIVEDGLAINEAVLDAIEGLTSNFSQLLAALGGQDPTSPPNPTTTVPTTDTTTAVASTTDPPTNACGGEGWTQVQLIDMSDPNQVCPEGLDNTTYPIRSCGQLVRGCSSVTIPTFGAQYRQVCGRATAYRFGYNYGFRSYHVSSQDLDDLYLDGLSLTYSSPRVHLWSFASGQFAGTSTDNEARSRCPCDEGNTQYPSPTFVGDHYFCESVATAENWDVDPDRFYPDNALWDGQGCEETGNSCCQHNNPPWFTRTIPATTKDIELRLCVLNSPEFSNIALTYLELYIQ